MAIGNSGNSTDVSFLRPPGSSTPVRDQPNTTGTGTASATPSAQAPGREVAPGSAASSGTSGTSEVSISAAAQELNRAPSTDPRAIFDSARVSEIRAAIEAGDYPLDSARLADNILRLEQELGL